MTLNLKTANQSSCIMLWPMMMHHHTSVIRKGSAVDNIQMNSHWNFEPFCDLDHDHNRATQSFHKTIQLHYDMPSNQV